MSTQPEVLDAIPQSKVTGLVAAGGVIGATAGTAYIFATLHDVVA